MNNLTNISQINKHLFLSGVYPLDEKPEIIKELNINYILSCVDRMYVAEIHDKIMMNNPDMIILYLPYNDDNQQNLWSANKKKINVMKYTRSVEEYENLMQYLRFYDNKPMIEIGYHFINSAIEGGKNVLVHCQAGVSRSASLVIYYIMKKYFVGYEEANQTVKSKRSIINPNESFKSQLLEYQHQKEKFTEENAQNIIMNLNH